MLKIDQLIRTRRRTLSLEINKDAELIVRAPLYMPQIQIDHFVAEKAQWILTHQERVRREKKRLSPITLTEGATFPLLGRPCSLHFANVSSIQLVGDSLCIPRGTTLTSLAQWLGRYLLVLLEDRVTFYAARLQMPVPPIKLANGKSRWGYCNYKNELGFNWRLVFCSVEAVDYVVVHELCHIHNKSHNRLFWKAVESILPDRKERERWLRINRRVMDIL
jgi:predicted metal-dependent hydrolase